MNKLLHRKSSDPQDFSVNLNRTYPTSCCASDITDQISISQHSKPLASPVVFRTDDGLREHQRNISDIAEVTWSHVIPRDSSKSSSGAILNSESKIIATCRAVYPQVNWIYYVHHSVWVNDDIKVDKVGEREGGRRSWRERDERRKLRPTTCAIYSVTM